MQCCRKYPEFIVEFDKMEKVIHIIAKALDYLTLNVAYLKRYTSGKMALAYNRAVYGEERQIGAMQPENTKKN